MRRRFLLKIFRVKRILENIRLRKICEVSYRLSEFLKEELKKDIAIVFF